MDEIQKAIDDMCGECTLKHRVDACLAADCSRRIYVTALREQAEREKGCEHCRGWDSRCGASYCPMCGRELGKRLEVEP